MRELGKHVHRIEHNEDDPFKPFTINHPIFNTEQEEIGTMDLCPYLRSGSCTWFSTADPGATSMIDGTENNRRFEYSAVARSSIYSSKSDKAESDADGLSSLVFNDTIENVYQLYGKKKTVPVDIVLASPSLEVGVDLPHLTESIMVKAIRNIASYRQKAGRVGRENNMDALNATLVTDSPVDLHYYRQPRKLVKDGTLEPVPLKEKNRSVVLSGLYQSVWDWLAMNSTLPEVIPGDWPVHSTVSQFRKDLEKCVEDIRLNHAEICNHLSSICAGEFPPHSSEVLDALGQAEDEIKAFLIPAAGTKTFASPLQGDYTVADVIARMKTSGHTAETPTGQMREQLRTLITETGSDWPNLKSHRRKLAKLESRSRVNLSAMKKLDKMFRHDVPNITGLKEVE